MNPGSCRQMMTLWTVFFFVFALLELCGTPGYLSPEVLQCSMFADAPGYGKEVDMWGSHLYLFNIHVHVHYMSMNKYYILLTNGKGVTVRISTWGLWPWAYKKDWGPISYQSCPKQAWLIIELLHNRKCY